jgi:hypothetical protein
MAVSQRQQDIARNVREIIYACTAETEPNRLRIDVLSTYVAALLGGDNEGVTGIVAGIIAALRPDVKQRTP